MIEVRTCEVFKVGDVSYTNIGDAQKAELMALGFNPDTASVIVSKQVAVAAILAAAAAPKLKTRRPYKRKPKEAAAVAPAATTSAA